MPSIVTSKTRSYGNIKPPVSSQINWSHPLSRGLAGCWLMNEGGGNVINNLANNIPYGTKRFNTITPYSGSFNWVAGKIYLDGASNNFLKINASFGNFNGIFETQVDYVTFVIGFTTTSLVATSDLMGNVGSTGHGPELRLNTNGSVHALGGASAWQNDGGILTPAGAVVTNKKHQLIASYIPYPFGNSKGFIAINGIKLVENTNNAEVAGGSSETTTKCFGANVDNASTISNRMTGYIEYVYIIIRKTRLSTSEIQQLYVEPYCFVAPQRNRFIIQMGAGEAPSGITYSSAKSMIYTY